MKKNLIKPCVIGLGYVGLPILINLSKKYKTIGYDNDLQRIKNLKDGKDLFNEFKNKDLKKKSIVYSHSINLIKNHVKNTPCLFLVFAKKLQIEE